MTRTPLTAKRPSPDIRADYPADGNVMAQNYDSDCPNYEDHEIGPDGYEICECWDGLTVDDIDTWTEPDGSIDVAGFEPTGAVRSLGVIRGHISPAIRISGKGTSA